MGMRHEAVVTITTIIVMHQRKGITGHRNTIQLTSPTMGQGCSIASHKCPRRSGTSKAARHHARHHGIADRTVTIDNCGVESSTLSHRGIPGGTPAYQCLPGCLNIETQIQCASIFPFPLLSSD